MSRLPNERVGSSLPPSTPRKSSLPPAVVPKAAPQGLYELWQGTLKELNLSAQDITRLNETEKVMDGEPVDLASLLLEYDVKGRGTKEATRLHRFIHDLRKLPSAQLGYQLKKPLAMLIAGLVSRNPPAPSAAPEEAMEVIPKATTSALCKMNRFACIDASSFIPAVNTHPDTYYRVLNYCWAAMNIDTVSRAYGSIRSYLAVKQKYELKDLMFAKRVTDTGKCGICTTFSAAAGGHLVEALIQSNGAYRVECVSPVSGNHCFVIVNRQGDAKDGVINPVTQEYWGDDWFVVDPWAASLGWDAIYMGVAEWQTMPNFITDHLQSKLTQHFDSAADRQLKSKYDALKGVDIVAAVEKARSDPSRRAS